MAEPHLVRRVNESRGCAMQQQHYAPGGLTDPHPVRPGTSAALTARTIDATVHPPIVRARDAVAEVIPRIAAPLSSPLFVGTIALTLLLGWAAIRNRLHARGFLVLAMMVLMLTSFRPMTDAEMPSVGDVAEPEKTPEPLVRPTPATPQPPDPVYTPELRTYQYTFDTRDLPESFQQLGLPSQINVELTMPERMMLDREILRAQMREFRIRIREEERRRHRHRRYYPD
jgi:hypothetical protein